MIVLDTSVLVYFLGAEHPLREPCRRIVGAIRAGQAEATTTVEVIQELVHVRARRRSRADAVAQGRDFAILLSPLLLPSAQDLDDGLAILEGHPGLGSFDAVLAATAMARGAEALVSPDRAFAGVPGITHLSPDAPEMAALLGS